MKIDQQYLYRGTTSSWAGNETSQFLQQTCATSDPLVATLFAVQARNFGPAVVYLFEISESTILLPSNVFDEVEAEVVVAIPPKEFASMAAAVVEVGTAIAVLESLGFELPIRLSGDQRLTRALEISYQRGDRLDIVQKRRFNDAVLGGT